MKYKIYSALLLLLLTLLLVSCVTTSSQQIEPWNIQGIQYIAIMPFELIGHSNLELQTAERLHSITLRCFQEAGFIIVEDVYAADAVFSGELIDIMSEQQYVSSQGTAYLRYSMTMIYNYNLIRTSDNSIIGKHSAHETRTHSFFLSNTQIPDREQWTMNHATVLLNVRLRQELNIR